MKHDLNKFKPKTQWLTEKLWNLLYENNDTIIYFLRKLFKYDFCIIQNELNGKTILKHIGSDSLEQVILTYKITHFLISIWSYKRS